MTLRQTLRNLYHLGAELAPWQAIRVAQGRDYDKAVLAAADQLADIEADDEVWEPLDPPAVVDADPLAPTAGPTPEDLQYAAGVINAFACFNAATDLERADLRALANRLTQ